MALGTAAAIGLGAAAIGSAVSGSSASKAAGKAADASLAVAKENNALQKEIYQSNQAALSPYMERGNVAGDYLNAFLGLPTTSTTTTTPGTTTTTNTGVTKEDLFSEEALAPWKAKYGSGWYIPYVQSGYGGQIGNLGKTTTPSVTTTTPNVTTAQAQNAFGNYIANSDYGFQFATGSNDVNSGYAGAGSLQSGAAMRALEEYRQNLQSGYRNEYTGLLANQQGVGLSGASALAGVGQNYASSVSANNTSAANAAANAALVKGNNNVFGNALSTIGGGLLGYGL